MLLKQLLLLNDLIPYHSFREASSALRIPESTLRTSIHQLEKELHCTLIHTDQRGIHWTATAQQLLPHIRRIHTETRELYRLPDLLHEVFSNKLSIACSSHFGSQLVTAIISEILLEYPSAQFSLQTLSNQTLLQQLIAQKLDFALLRIHDIEAPIFTSSLHSLPLLIEPLAQDKICFLVGPLHPLYNCSSAPLKKILQFSRLISKDPIDSLTHTFFEKYGYHNTILQISNIISLRHLVQTTNYISWQSIAAAQNSLQSYQDALHILKIEDISWSCTLYSASSYTPTFGERILKDRLKKRFTNFNERGQQ